MEPRKPTEGLRGGGSALLPDAKRSDRAAHALILSSCRRFHTGEQAALGQGALGEQFVEILDAAFGMEMLIERIVQVARIQGRFRILRPSSCNARRPPSAFLSASGLPF